MKNRILISASFFHALTDATTTVAPMAFPLLYAQGRLITSYTQIGLLSNLGLLATLFIQFLVVKVSYQVEYRVLLLFSLLGICASLAALPLATSFLTLLVLFLFLRLFASFYHPIIIAWVAKSQPAQGLDLAMGIQSGSGNFGVLLAFLSVGYLAQRWDWKMPLFAWGIFGLILGGIGWAVLHGISSKSADKPSLGVMSWMKVLGGIRHLIPGFIVGGMGWSVIIYYAPSLLNHRFAVPIGRTGLYLALWIGLGTISGYCYGILSRRFGRRNVFLVSIGLGSISLAAIGFAPGRSVAVAGLLAFGISLLMTYPSLHTFVGSTVPRASQTLAFSWVSNIQILAGALITLLAGVLSDRYGIRAPFVLSFMISAVCFVFYAVPGELASRLEGTAEEVPPVVEPGA